MSGSSQNKCTKGTATSVVLRACITLNSRSSDVLTATDCPVAFFGRHTGALNQNSWSPPRRLDLTDRHQTDEFPHPRLKRQGVGANRQEVLLVEYMRFANISGFRDAIFFSIFSVFFSVFIVIRNFR